MVRTHTKKIGMIWGAPILDHQFVGEIPICTLPCLSPMLSLESGDAGDVCVVSLEIHRRMIGVPLGFQCCVSMVIFVENLYIQSPKKS